MGIPGLLQGLKSYTQAGNIRDFRGQAIAVDASSWLHKSVYPIAEHYVEATWGKAGGNNSMEDYDDSPQHQRQQPTPSVDAHSVKVSTDYMLKRCQELVQHAGIRRIYLVFDGKRCPLKAGTNAERERKRQEHLEQARKYRKLSLAAQSSHGQKQQYREQMFHHYKICIKVTQALADAVADKLQQYCNSSSSNNNSSRRSGCCAFELVFSPYEADAQLVQLVVAGLAQAVVTEDSDVLVYSAACQHAFPTLFKLDRQTGSCQILSMNWLLANNTQEATTTTAAASRKQPHQPPRRSALLPMTAAEQEEEVEKKTSQQGNSSRLENILSCFAERQGREPGGGRGSRLFVQACILTGCDYAPNLLQGIGLVTAFKHVRSCMHRSPDQRFRHVLKLLPQKAKRGILLLQQPIINTSSTSSSSPMDAYEELLAKSEAVFYYHPVLDTVARRVTFFTPPNTSSTTSTTTTTTTRISNNNKNTNNGSVNGHSGPSLARFQGDWSFLSNPHDYHDLQPSAHHNDRRDHDDDDDDEDDTQDSWLLRPTSRPTSSHSLSFTSSSRQLQQPISNKQPTAPPVNVQPPPQPAASTAHPSNKSVPPFVVMANPYRRTNKRPIQDDNNYMHDENDNRPEKRQRGPLAPKSPNLELNKKKKNTTASKNEEQKSRRPNNLFAKFAAQKNDKENPPAAVHNNNSDDDDGQLHNLQNFVSHRKKSDIRFVKPAFDTNGTRIVAAAPKQQPQPAPLQLGLLVTSPSSQQCEPPQPPVAASFSLHASQLPFGESVQQPKHDFSTTRQHQQSRDFEAESNYFSQRACQRHQQEEQGIREKSSRTIFTGFDDEEEGNVSECDDANRQSQQEQHQQPSFLDPTTHCCRFGGTKENTVLPLVSSEEGFDYEEELVEPYQSESSSTLVPPSRCFESNGDMEQVNDAALPLFQDPSFYENEQHDTAQHHNTVVLSTRPLFARHAHSLKTGLEFEEDNEDVEQNFNDLIAPAPFRNPSFCNDENNHTSHNVLSSGLEFDGGENESGADNFVDLTETSCPPFENSPFCADEQEEQGTTTTRSDYFARPRLGSGFSRRVTLESPAQSARSSTATFGRLQNNPIFQPDLPRPAQFDLYDDFLSPKKASPAEEDIDDSPPKSGNHHRNNHPGQHGVSLSFNLYSQRSQQAAPPPKAKSTIGPAKTLRKRFKSCGKVNNNNPLAKAFERQRQIAAFEGSTSTSSFGRGGTKQAAQAHRRRLPNLNQSTLMFSFSSSSHHHRK